jgi:Ferroportin1 (FPN1)
MKTSLELDNNNQEALEMSPLYASEGEGTVDTEQSSPLTCPTISSTIQHCTLPSATPLADIIKARRILYCSHLFAMFASICWDFGLSLFLAALTHYQSLFLLSTYGLVSGLAVVIFLERTGRMIDQSNRLTVVRLFVGGNNGAVLLATLCCYMLTKYQPDSSVYTQSANIPHAQLDNNQGNTSETTAKFGSNDYWASRLEFVPTDPVSIAWLVVLHILGAVAQVLSQSFLVAMERDWIIVISKSASVATDSSCAMNDTDSVDGVPMVVMKNRDRTDRVKDSLAYTKVETDKDATDNEENYEKDGNDCTRDQVFRQWLTDTNVTMKQIDLGCKVAAPAMVGFLFPALSLADTESQSLQAAGLQWICLGLGTLNLVALIVEYTCTMQIYRLVPALAVKDRPREVHENHELKSVSWINSMQIYFSQPICWGGLGLALLYANSLTLGNGVMTAYLLYRGMKMQGLGISRAVASVVGLSGTFVYHWSVKRMSLEATGMWSITYQWTCLLLCYASLYIEANMPSVTLLVTAVCASRVGLWVFDIAVTQLQQQEVPAECQGVVGGVQQSLSSFFFLTIFIMGILYPDPEQFHIFIKTGLVAVGAAMTLFWTGIVWPRARG